MRSFIVLGKTGVGKSSFINATFGLKVAHISHFEPCTSIVETYVRTTTWGDVCLVDTPGLSEGSEKSDLLYLELIKQYMAQNKVDFSIYVSRLDENRFRPDEKGALALITQKLGAAIWKKAWIAFTFAGCVRPEKLDAIWRYRLNDIQSYIADQLGSSDLFPGFSTVLLVDNYASGWCRGAVPIASLLTSSRGRAQSD